MLLIKNEREIKMSQAEQAVVSKKVVSKEDFNKRVEIEYAFLFEIERLPQAIAKQKAYETVSESYEIQ